MEKTNLKSLRIPVDTLDEINRFVEKYHYTNAHAVMVSCLENLFHSADYHTIKTLFTHWRYSERKLVIKITEESHS